MSELVVALDQGSSSSRALAIDAKGKVVAWAKAPVETRRPRAGWFEHDANALGRGVEQALDIVLAKTKKFEIAGVGLAAQRSTIVFWDEKTGKPLGPALSWQDGRAAEAVKPLLDRSADAHRITGLYLTPYYSAPKIRWALDNVAAVRRAFDGGRLLVGPVSTYLLWRLTRGDAFVADPTMAQRTMLLDIETLDWSGEMLSLFDIPRAILPAFCPSAGEVGVIERKGRKLKLLASVGDQQAAALGLGGGEAGASVANYGTGAFFLHNTGENLPRIPGLLTSVGWKVGARRPCYLSEGTVHAAGTSFDWLRDNLGLLKKSQDVDTLCRASTERVFALQAIGGLGAPRWDYKTKTAFFGLSSRTRPADIVRAVAEGVAFLISDIVAAMRAGGLSPARACASGGLSRVDYLMQFQADVTGLRVERAAETEATAFGAASLALEAAGAADWAARLRKPKIALRFDRKMDRSEAARLADSWRKFVDAQAALSRAVSLE